MVGLSPPKPHLGARGWCAAPQPHHDWKPTWTLSPASIIDRTSTTSKKLHQPIRQGKKKARKRIDGALNSTLVFPYLSELYRTRKKERRYLLRKEEERFRQDVDQVIYWPPLRSYASTSSPIAFSTAHFQIKGAERNGRGNKERKIKADKVITGSAR